MQIILAQDLFKNYFRLQGFVLLGEGGIRIGLRKT